MSEKAPLRYNVADEIRELKAELAAVRAELAQALNAAVDMTNLCGRAMARAEDAEAKLAQAQEKMGMYERDCTRLVGREAALDKELETLGLKYYAGAYHNLRAEAAEAKLKQAQAKIDALMLEYCPDEMTPEQMAEWERHQKSYGMGAGIPIEEQK